jgi:Ca2+-binding RTX toxin-like protein
VLEGGAGADHLDGRGGIDTASYAHSAAGVTVSLTTGVALGGDAQGDTLSGFENLRGTAFADTLAGDTGDNTLEGDAGADALYGGAGSDTASYAHSAAGVQVDVYGQTATGGDAEGDTLIGIENLIGSAFDDVLKLNGAIGGALSGGAGDDILKGSGAAAAFEQSDIFDGGAGFDMVFANLAAGSWVDLQIGLGLGDDGTLNDTFISIEGLTGSTGDDRLLGGDADNIFYGGEGRDILSGRAGADILSGGYAGDQLDGGSDIASYYTSISGVTVNLTTGTASGGDAAGDTLTSIEGLSGSNLGNDSLAGNAGANVLRGWGGDDVLTGAGGKDSLIGGAGADRFIYGSTADSAVGANADVIGDFSHAQGDRISLSVIDADTGAAGNQAFSFIGTAAYTGAAGQLRFHSNGITTTIAGDVDGDGVSDFHIQLTGAIGLVAGDFVL